MKAIAAAFDGNLNANEFEAHSLGVIPDGKSWRVRYFGGGATGKGADDSARVTLEKRPNDASPWEVIRAYGLSQSASQFPVDMEFAGDGALELRIVRSNGAGSPKDVTAWITGYEH